MCLNKQDSEYPSGPKYAKILNMAKFWICKRYTVFWIYQNMPWQSSEYILGSKCVRILNMAGFWICKCYAGLENHNIAEYRCEYSWMWISLNMSEFTIIDRVLNMYHTIYSARSLYKLTSTNWGIGVFRNGQRSKMEPFGKIIIVFNYFCKKLHLKSLRNLYRVVSEICIGF